ncbi:MAG: YozE family protein [Oscillospiraceae bacterium]|nr:YozE family protein [Oscillospiraceae bacterium]
MSFYKFMMKYHLNESGPAGDLAKDMKADKDRFPINRPCKFEGWHSLIRAYLERNHACSSCLRVFEECWEEYVRCVKKK